MHVCVPGLPGTLGSGSTALVGEQGDSAKMVLGPSGLEGGYAEGKMHFLVS